MHHSTTGSSAPHQIAAPELFWCLHWSKCPAHPSWGITGLGQAVLRICKGTADRPALTAVGDCSPKDSRTGSLLPCLNSFRASGGLAGILQHSQGGSQHYSSFCTPRLSVY